jgi:CheY-like chemotaxis protein
MYAASSPGTVAGPGAKVSPTKVLYFSFHCHRHDKEVLMEVLKRILLVEDDPKDIELILAALSEHNLANEVVVARDGLEALDYLHRREPFAQHPPGNPVVILLDLKMPRMDGVQLLGQIKADEKLRLIPVVVLTSSRESPDLKTCYGLGINAYVVKPVRFKEFVEAVMQTGMFWALINNPPPDNA